jgi:hypothetical protein
MKPIMDTTRKYISEERTTPKVHLRAVGIV